MKSFIVTAMAALGIAACNQSASTASAPAAGLSSRTSAFAEEYASVAVNDIVKSMRLNVTAKTLGQDVYDKSCSACHGADLKGVAVQHTPDLTDSEWRFAGDDLDSAGLTKLPSDVEWTVRYGIRSGHPYARGLEADMVAFDPQFRTAEDTKELGARRFLTPDEISDVA